jgi:hypothetical protein
MQRELADMLATIGARTETWKAFPIRTLTPHSVVAAPRALLVGDAAGVDPLMGEGISFALEYGELAAEAVVEAQATGDWAFAGLCARGPPGTDRAEAPPARPRRRLFYGPRVVAHVPDRGREREGAGDRHPWY